MQCKFAIRCLSLKEALNWVGEVFERLYVLLYATCTVFSLRNLALIVNKPWTYQTSHIITTEMNHCGLKSEATSFPHRCCVSYMFNQVMDPTFFNLSKVS